MSAKENLLRWNSRHGPAAEEFIQNFAKQPEAKLRGILRPYHESEDDKQRDDFDNVLEYLLLLELGLETQTIQLTDIEKSPILPALKILLESAAVARYCDTYLYFGVRLWAGRILPARRASEHESNTRPLSLPSPPDVESAGTVVETFLELKESDRGNAALRFLDGDVECDDEPQNYELWLRGLRFESDSGKSRFRALTERLIHWILDRYEFYKSWVESDRLASRTDERGDCVPVEFGDRFATNPLAARFALVDFYWLAKLLGAEVSSNGIVTYKSRCLIQSLRDAAPVHPSAANGDELESAEKVLRAVFDFACDLIQNAVEIRNERERRSLPDYRERAKDALGWRQSYDTELEEIDKQRKERGEPEASPRGGGVGAKREKDYWSQRVKTGFVLKNLVGLAFSGGGIRSATFNLGVLEGLKEGDLLRRVDYLSTVSGGGYIGAWLLGNVKRTPHWLSRRENWGDSIAHLRRYSDYLSPQVGLLSADTWAMWGIWGRNAFLIQLMTIAWLAVVLAGARLMQNVFARAGLLGQDGRILLGVVILLVSVVSALNVSRQPRPGTRAWTLSQVRWVNALVVVPAGVGAFLAAAMLWNQACKSPPEYGEILTGAFEQWKWSFAIIAAALLVLSLCSFDRGRWRTFAGAVQVLLCPAVCAGVLYLEVCGVVWVFRQWAHSHPGAGPWLAFVFGPPLIIVAVSVAIAMFLGMLGILSQDWRREWWTRVGSYLGIYGILAFAAALASVLGPYAILEGLAKPHPNWSLAAAAGWAGSVISGLLSGNSSKTDGGRKKGSSPVLDWVAKIAAVLFIAGAILIVATVLHLVLVHKWLPADTGSYWLNSDQITGADLSITLAIVVVAGIIFSWRFDINIFSLNHFYRNRLVRCYLGATRWLPGLRQPHKFTGFDEKDDLLLSSLQQGASGMDARPFRGPFPIVNCSLNLGGSSDLSLHTRHSASFSMTPLRCGADRENVGYAPTGKKQTSLLTLGHAISVSGAAASPNSGYHTSPLVALLLTMFNVRLAWWFPNPGARLSLEKQDSPTFGLYYLICELFGLADEESKFVNISDGGHFENLGIYELVRRRCKVIIASDGECDPNLDFGSLGNVIRMCETDFGAKIDLDVASVRKQAETRMSRAHCAVGRISYSNGSRGYLIYLKASITGEEDVGIEQYRSEHPAFPHESTAEQFFSEDQFEAYRRLGCHIAQKAFRNIAPGSDPIQAAEKMYDLWTPAGSTTDSFVKHAKLLDKIWERFRRSVPLQALFEELLANTLTPPPPAISDEEVCACLELVQLMENVFLDLRLDDFWEHPDNRGWALLFTQWAKSGRFRAVWPRIKNTFGIRFEHFCADRLGLLRSASVARA